MRKQMLKMAVYSIVMLCFLTAHSQTNSKLSELMKAYSVNGKDHIGAPFTGAVLVAKDGKIIFKDAYGLLDRDNEKANQVSTIFPIGSVTKQFTSMLVMQLVEDKKINLEDVVAKHLPYLEETSVANLTIHQLLSHTSGLPHYEGIFDLGISQRGFMTSIYTPKELALLVSKVKPIAKAGERFHYSSLGYMLLGTIAEEVSGQSFANLLDNRIVKPLGLKHTGFANNEFIASHTAKGYRFKKDKSGSTGSKYGGKFFKRPTRDQSNLYTTGGMHSTVEDLFLWSEAIKNNTLLSKENTKKMLQQNKEGYGYGWFKNWDELIERNINARMITHGGTLFGHSASITIYEDGTTVIFLSNVSNIKDHRLIHKLHLTANYLDDEYGMKGYPNRRNLSTFEAQGGLKALKNYFNELSGYCGYEVLPSKNSILGLTMMYYKDGQQQVADDLKRILYKNYRPTEADINRLGYEVMKSDCKLAVKIFEENTMKHNSSANAFDSLAEGYLTCGNIEEAISNYKKAVAIAEQSNSENLEAFKKNLENAIKTTKKN